MKKILIFLFLLFPLWVHAGGTRVYQGGSVTITINPQSTGMHTITTGGAEFRIDAGLPTFGEKPRFEIGMQGSGGTPDDRIVRIYAIESTSDATPVFGTFRARRANGVDPSAVLSGNVVGMFNSYPYDGVDYIPHSAGMAMVAAANFSDSSRPTDVALFNTPSGSTTNQARLYISASGEIDIKTQTLASITTPYTPTARLTLSDDAAKPFAIIKSTVAVAAPGAGYGLLRWEAGTNAGTLKLVAYSGTSTTGVAVIDNVGAGN